MSLQEIKQTNTPKNTMKQFSALPSCFLTPESTEKPHDFGRVTPTPDRSSSVFLSPPSSLERKTVPNFAISTSEDPIKLELDFSDYLTKRHSTDSSLSRSPLLPEDRIIGRTIERTKIDFITDLLKLNCNRICENICGYLSNRDLCRFASVCKSWRIFTKNDSHIHDRLDSYLLQCKQYCILKGKENLGLPTTNLKDISSQNTKRTPFLDIHINKTRSNGRLSKTASTLPDLKQEAEQSMSAYGNFRPCPKCSSPSNYAKVLDGHCHCQRCGLEFCPTCLKDSRYHRERTCRGLENPQEKIDKRTKSRKKGKDNIVGSRKSKERMRRL